MNRIDQTRQVTISGLELLAAGAIALLTLGMYLRTLHPAVGPSFDSIELQIAALVRGVIHPPGSPQYLMLGRFMMSVLPGPNLAFRLNLFSALCAAATVGIIHLVSYRLTENLIISSFAALMLAFGVRMWYLASIAELYALNALYISLVFYLLLAWHQTRKPGLFWGAVVVYVFSFGNHVSMILLLPAFLYMVTITDRQMLFKPLHLLIAAGIVGAAALQYLYIPLRAMAEPPLCNYCPEAISSLGAYISGPMLDYVTGGPFKASMFALSPTEVLVRAPDSIGLWNKQFMPWGYILGIIGVWELFKRRSELAWMFTLGITAEYVFVITYAIPDWPDFLLPAYVLFAPLIAYGTLRIWQKLEPLSDDLLAKGYTMRSRAYLVGFGVLMVLAVGISIYFNLPQVDQSTYDDYMINSQALLRDAGDDAYFIMPHPDSPAFYYSWAVRYTSYADGLAPGLIVVSRPEVDPPPGPEPYYVRWTEVAAQFTPDALLESKLEIYLVDWADDRPEIQNLGLLPICAPDEQTVTGYRAIAVRVDDQIKPLVPETEWETLRDTVSFDGQNISCN